MANEIPEAKVTIAPPAESATSGKAIASFILGLCSFFCMFFTGSAAVILGILSLSDIRKSAGRLSGDAFAIIGIISGALGCLWTIPILIALLLPAVQATREAARRAESMNNMRQMVLGMHNFEVANGRFPNAIPVASESGRGDSKLSWRVQILPFIEHNGLYTQFNHDEPWDSPHNLALVDQMPDVFKSRSHLLEAGKTIYVVPTTKPDADPQLQTIFAEGRSLTFQGILDGTSNTIVLLEVNPEAAVVWTKPEDWEFDPTNPNRGLGNARPGIFLSGMADGSIQTLDKDIDPELLRTMLTARAGD